MNKIKYLFVFLLMTLLISSSIQANQNIQSTQNNNQETNNNQKSEIVVSLNVGITLNNFTNKLNEINKNINVVSSFYTKAPKRLRNGDKNAKTLKLLLSSETLNVNQLIELIISIDVVEYVEENVKMQTLSVPSDPEFSQSWPLQERANDTDLDIQKAWDTTYGNSDMVVGMIDDGIEINHPDLKDSLYVNEAELNGQDGVDDDNNGFIDDIYGWSPISNNKNLDASNFHGTSVAGIMVAQRNNNKGSSGIVPDSKILSCAASNSDGKLYGTLQCLVYMNTLKAYYNEGDSRGVNIIAINNSYENKNKIGIYSQSKYDAIQISEEENILFVAPARNHNINTDIYAHYPSDYELDNIVYKNN